jgi:triosephosphate isomerase
MTIYVGTSWKMTKTGAEADAFVEVLNAAPEWPRGVQPFVMPAHTVLARVRESLHSSTGVWMGAQNAHWMPPGAHTGEISMSMVADTGATMVELGHSERRAGFNETDDIVNRKVHSALAAGLVPLVCVGEQASDVAQGRSAERVLSQVEAALYGLDAKARAAVMIAYEPVWAIGSSGRPADASHVERVISRVKERAVGPVLYGGSVDVDNALEYLETPGVDGLFVGRSAWDPAVFLQLVGLASAVAGELRRGQGAVR